MPKRQPTTSRRTVTGFVCRICHTDKPLDGYEPDAYTRSGYRSECRDCHKASKLAAYHRRKAEINAARKQKYDSDPIRFREQALTTFRLHGKRYQERRKAYRVANGDKARADNRRRRAALASASGHYDDADVLRIFNRQRGHCFWCQCRLPAAFVVDHVLPLSRGGPNYPENLVVACRPCNSSKYDLFPAEWRHGRRKAVRLRKIHHGSKNAQEIRAEAADG